MIRRLQDHRLILAWLLLVGVTCAAWLLGHGPGVGGHVAGAVVLLLAFAKVHIIAHEFMGLREAPQVMRRMANGWILTVGALLIALQLATWA